LCLFLSQFYKKAWYPNFLISLHRKCKVEDCRIECRCWFFSSRMELPTTLKIHCLTSATFEHMGLGFMFCDEL
jgi:hypothetical protein